MIRVAVIMGPTASGKSALALRLAERLGRGILVADSRQVYRGLRIGTAQPSADERARVAHHLVDFLPLDQRWSAQAFAEAALESLRREAGAPPLVVGGTGFYLRSLMQGLFPLAVGDNEIKRRRAELASLDTPALASRLATEDPATAARLAPRDRQRILRALEVKAATGVPLSEHHRRGRQAPQGIDWRPVRLVLPRERLHARIAARLEAMLAGGWLDEVRALLEAGADPEWPGLKTLGYPEVVARLRGEIDEAAMRERVLAKTRQYAKRQETWFRAETGAAVLDPEAPDALARLEALAGG